MYVTTDSAKRILNQVATADVDSTTNQLTFDLNAAVEAIHHKLKGRHRNQILSAAWLTAPDALTANDALRMLLAKLNDVLSTINHVDEVFKAAKADIEASYAAHDSACNERIEAIQESIHQITIDFEQKRRNQGTTRKAYEELKGKGFTPAAISAMGIAVPAADEREQRNEWAAEQKSLIDPLIAERDGLVRFKQTRNESLLSPAVLAKVAA